MLNKKIDELRSDIVNTTIDLVKVKTLAKKEEGIYPYGEDVAKLLDTTLEKCRALGFKTKNIDNYVGYAEMGEGEDYVVALGHLDVVPEGEGWDVPPYSGEIKDGFIYGRGTADDKGPVVAALYGAKAIMDSGLKLSKRIRIVFGTAEEIGGDDIEHYLKFEKPPVAGFTPDAEFPIINGEKGIVNFNLIKKVSSREGELSLEWFRAGKAVNVVPNFAEAKIVGKDLESVKLAVEAFNKTSERKVAFKEEENALLVSAKGVNAHGSTPELGENAIMTMVKFLTNVSFNSEVDGFIKFLDTNIGYDLIGEQFGAGLKDKVSGNLSFNVGCVDFTRENLVLKVNLRYPVTKNIEDAMAPIKERCNKEGIEVEVLVHSEPLYFEPSHPLIKTLQKVYTEQTGEEATLISIGGGTYAKEIPNTVAFGPKFPDEEDCIHKPNERVNIENLVKSAKIYAHALYELAR